MLYLRERLSSDSCRDLSSFGRSVFAGKKRVAKARPRFAARTIVRMKLRGHALITL